ncbi:MAG TPA: T9SS type A sorting domain-containing protein [Salinivirgaceae bacterium]|nr:T9SS type A sorting domain-containing protein [Salinivirgaceae bacterium]HRS67614.1 T9SS type A sorting domain-containing protein [Paludibacteraceae bacterium]
MFNRSLYIILLLLVSTSVDASTWFVSTTNLVRGDTIFQTYYTYNSSSQPVLSSTKISVNNSAFINYSYTELQFENDLKVSSSTFLWDGIMWKKSIRTEWVYDKGLLKSRKELHNVADNWLQTEQTLYSYDTTNNLTREITQTYATNWQNRLKTDYSYNNTIKTITCSTAQGALWQPYARITVDSTHGYYSVTLEEFDSVWHTRTRTIYNENSSGQALNETQQSLHGTIWRNEAKRSFTYDNNNVINGELLLSWNTEYWGNIQRYKSEKQNLETITTYYTPLYNAWWPAYTHRTVLNDDFLPAQIVTDYQFWGKNNAKLRTDFLPIHLNNITNLPYAHSLDLTYESHENTPTEILKTAQDITIYPNPSPNGIFYVEGNYKRITAIWIYSLHGQLIKHISYPESKTIDITELNKGIYLSKIQTQENETFTTKLIKSH